jgi:hypothetical protein
MDPRLRPPWTEVILETQERFPVRGDDQPLTDRRVLFVDKPQGHSLRFTHECSALINHLVVTFQSTS